MGWFGRLSERLLGYRPVGFSWRLYPSAVDHPEGHTLPARIPIPRDVWRGWSGGERPDRLPHEQIATLAQRFLEAYPRHELAGEFSLFVAKAPLAARVEEALKKGAWQDAEVSLREVNRLDPQDRRARMLTGLCLQQQGRLDEAEQCYREIEPAMRASADFHAFRGGLHEHRRQLDGAKAAYRAALDIQADHALALERMAALGEMVEIYLGDLDHPEKAYVPVEAYEKTMIENWQRQPQTVDFYLERSDFHLRQAQGRLALAAAARAEDLLGEVAGTGARSEVLAARGRALIALERYAEADQVAAELRRIAPEAAETYSCIGQLLWFTGRREEAAPWIVRAIQADPNRVENLQLYLKPEFPRKERDPLRSLIRFMNEHPQSFAIKSVAASLQMAAGQWPAGVKLATEAAALGAPDEMLVELTGRMGRQGFHEEVAALAEAAGGWRRFLHAHALLRSNLAASLYQVGEAGAAQALWDAIVEDDGVHPDIRRRARDALRRVTDAAGAP